MASPEDIRKRIIYDSASSYMPGQVGSPTKAEVTALVSMFHGKDISDETREGILLTARGGGRKLVEDHISAWNDTPTDLRPKICNIAMPNLAAVMADRGLGLIDYSGLILTNLQIAFQIEATKKHNGKLTGKPKTHYQILCTWSDKS